MLYNMCSKEKEDEMEKYYSADIAMPSNKKEGMLNFLQMIINELEEGNSREELLKTVDLRQDVMSDIYKVSSH